MSKIGLISDIHYSYNRGNRINPSTLVNQREEDVYNAAVVGVRNLLDRNVEAIVDLGDMAHVPLPRKRAIQRLIWLVRNVAHIPYYSANGNHTLQRSATDMHLYDFLSDFAGNFHGYTTPGMTPFGFYLVPYGSDEEIKRALDQMPHDAIAVGGHWAAEDVPFPGAHVKILDLPDTPVFLGHYHTRMISQVRPRLVYVGATERYSWGEATNPTGVAVFDTETGGLEFIDHYSRKWTDIRLTPDNYLEDSNYEGTDDAIVRVTILASPEQYHSLDLVAIKKKLAGTLEYQIRRSSRDAQIETSTETFSLLEGWRKHIGTTKIPRGIAREEVQSIGEEALEQAGAT